MSSESDLSVAEKVQTAQDVPRSNGDAELQMHRTRSSGIYPQLPIAGQHNMSKLKFALFLVGVSVLTYVRDQTTLTRRSGLLDYFPVRSRYHHRSRRARRRARKSR